MLGKTLVPLSIAPRQGPGVSTWKGEEWKKGGGTTWGWYSYDPELNLLYHSTGNPGAWNAAQRPGENKCR